MAAATQPLDGNAPEQEGWQTLVGDQRYRLFAAGNRRAAIAECLPAQSRAAASESLPPAPRSFDARYGLRAEAEKRLVLLTEVSRVRDESPRGTMPAGSADEGSQWRWEATHRVQSVSHLKSYIDEQSGSCVFFLTRSKQPTGAPGARSRERLADSAVRIGRSLGLDAKNLEALRVAGIVHELGKIAPARAAGRTIYVTPAGADEREEGERCRAAECANAATAHLLAEPFCTEHFINECYQRLDWCADRLSTRPASEEEAERLASFLHSCIAQTRILTRDPFHQQALERARLLDILHTSTELSRHVRRSERLPQAIPIRLLCETPGRPWEENLRTKLISRHGAMLECEHIVRPEDWLFVERIDTGARTHARMAWRGSVICGRLAVALEFPEADNFWDQNWAERNNGGRTKGATA